ncbi:ferredoxin subunit of nitrite reductase and ring-hydroxylating dioxygenase [Methylophilaceae bacterium 11]|jgi:nitrite reductase/ring-hydroxylating ferredoxin subunit|uniref:Rieske (2Fe-2S) protein n=1 Tax=unclassified Methylotenera TaxID=2643294 RepID=UPI00036733F1|nr:MULTISPECIES: Rieske 2Fe-2S domain-containing protein [unclassified Methylotenera]EUJ10511.1 ferredoxin subunit of nitrite reductase and ring-hydroxylating dioxygenase [Methylophilaceae bacterium 11]
MKVTNIRFKSSDLIEKSDGLRFNVPQRGELATGFVVRFNGKPYAYLNQCAHVPIELDWQQGKFFNLTQDFIICATHGAHYEPNSGRCVLGPCKGKSLQPIEVYETNDEIIINLESIP